MAKKNKFRGRVKKEPNPHRINHEIRAKEVRIVGENLDEEVMSFKEGLAYANDKGLDLVMVGEKATPPICKLMNYEKFLYEKKKQKPQKKPLPVKEIRLTPNTGENDLEFKIKHAVNFLKKGHKVKAFVFFRGREMAHQDRGQIVLLKFIEALEEYGLAEAMPKMEGRKMNVFIKPIKKKEDK
jgi:translation initiation factor IF-3